MSDSVSQSNEEISPDVEKLLDAANSASQTVAALHVAFMALVSYVGIIVWGTTHKDLLLISPVKLPVLDVELPLTTFNGLVPWLLVLLHFNLLIQLELLSRKLWNLDKNIPATPAGQQLRDRLFIFPFTNLIAGRSSVQLINCLLSLVVGVTVIALPLLTLLAVQIRFLPFHDEVITWSQRLAIWVDSVMLLSLWPLIASPNDSALEWWQNAGYRLLGIWTVLFRYIGKLGGMLLTQIRLPSKFGSPKIVIYPQPKLQSEFEPKGLVFLLVSIPLTILLSIIAVIPGNITFQKYYSSGERNSQSNKSRPDDSPLPYHFEDWLINKVPQSWLSVAAYQYDNVSCTKLTDTKSSDTAILQVMIGPCVWFNLDIYSRNLYLFEATLVPKDVSVSQANRAIDNDKTIREAAFKEFEGLNLEKRDLRFANFSGALLPKVKIRGAQTQGAAFLKARFQGVSNLWGKDNTFKGATLGGAEFPGVSMTEADLRGADFRGANLQGADLSWAHLENADLRGASLQAATLRSVRLQGADLRGARLQGANLREANLQGANLDFTNLQGADLTRAILQGAVFENAQLYGVDWSGADLNGVYFSEISMDWKKQDQRRLELILKPLMDIENFSAFQTRMISTISGIPSRTSYQWKDCYSNNPTFLECNYRYPEQLETYRSKILFPKLIELACSDVTIAIGISKRGFEEFYNYNKELNFGLAASLLKALSNPKPCEAWPSYRNKPEKNY